MTFTYRAKRGKDEIIGARFAFDDHDVVNQDVNAKWVLRIAQVPSLVDNRTRCFKLRLASVRLKLVRKRMLIDLFKYARPSKFLEASEIFPPVHMV